ncbi:hypothetical protein [Serinicoccus sp. LYQ92]|uniref:hypothetical protein n=1 Tax=Serinicoccus sp. LYQ92 TaxID=3378798 RepID=UPI003862174D
MTIRSRKGNRNASIFTLWGDFVTTWQRALPPFFSSHIFRSDLGRRKDDGMYKVGGGGAVAAGGGLAYTGAPLFAYALVGVALLVLSLMAYRFASVRGEG